MYIVRSRHASIFKGLKLLMEPILNKVSLYPITVDFHGFDNDTVTASFLAKYLTKQFERRFKIRDLFGPIGKDLRRIMARTPYLLGYKLQFVGRLTRRDRLRTS